MWYCWYNDGSDYLVQLGTFEGGFTDALEWADIGYGAYVSWKSDAVQFGQVVIGDRYA